MLRLLSPKLLLQILPLNAHSKAEVTHFPSGVQWTDTQHNPEFLVGDKVNSQCFVWRSLCVIWSDWVVTFWPFTRNFQAFYTNPKDPYSLHWPMRRGRLNLHDGVGGSLTAIVQDLVDIWAYALENQLDIPIKDLMVRKTSLCHCCGHFSQNIVLHFSPG